MVKCGTIRKVQVTCLKSEWRICYLEGGERDLGQVAILEQDGKFYRKRKSRKRGKNWQQVEEER